MLSHSRKERMTVIRTMRTKGNTSEKAIERSPEMVYNMIVGTILQQAACAGALQAIRLMQVPLNLENSIGFCNELFQRSEEDMSSRQQFRVTLPTGEKVWATGSSLDSLFAGFVQKYGHLYVAPKSDKATEPSRPTLRSFVDETYRDAFMSRLKPTSKQNYEDYLQRYILPFMGDIPMDEITVATIQAFYDYLASGASHGLKKDLNEKTIIRIRGLRQESSP